nr:MAG TPA: hypothetical protein [Caudoviricetes sp.]
MPDHDQRRSLSYGRAYHLKGGPYAEQRRGGIALLMMIMPSVSITFFEIFCRFFRGWFPKPPLCKGRCHRR